MKTLRKSEGWNSDVLSPPCSAYSNSTYYTDRRLYAFSVRSYDFTSAVRLNCDQTSTPEDVHLIFTTKRTETSKTQNTKKTSSIVLYTYTRTHVKWESKRVIPMHRPLKLPSKAQRTKALQPQLPISGKRKNVRER